MISRLSIMIVGASKAEHLEGGSTITMPAKETGIKVKRDDNKLRDLIFERFRGEYSFRFYQFDKWLVLDMLLELCGDDNDLYETIEFHFSQLAEYYLESTRFNEQDRRLIITEYDVLYAKLITQEPVKYVYELVERHSHPFAFVSFDTTFWRFPIEAIEATGCLPKGWWETNKENYHLEEVQRDFYDSLVDYISRKPQGEIPDPSDELFWELKTVCDYIHSI